VTRRLVVVGVGCAALALAGCASTAVDKVYTGGFWVEPGKFEFLKCPDLGRTSVSLSTREQELMSLMARADQEAAGPVINLMVYRSDLELVRAQLAEVQKTEREKNCENLIAPSPTPSAPPTPPAQKKR